MRLTSMISAVDPHAGGEPGCVIVGGVLVVPGKKMFEKMKYVATHADGLRKRMLREPRGYPASNCNLVLPPTRPDAHAAPGSLARAGAATRGREPTTPRPVSLRAPLHGLVALCILPPTLLAGWLAVEQYQQLRERIYLDTVLLARRYAAELDRELAAIESSLRILASAPELNDDDLTAFDTQHLDQPAARQHRQEASLPGVPRLRQIPVHQHGFRGDARTPGGERILGHGCAVHAAVPSGPEHP